MAVYILGFFLVLEMIGALYIWPNNYAILATTMWAITIGCFAALEIIKCLRECPPQWPGKLVAHAYALRSLFL